MALSDAQKFWTRWIITGLVFGILSTIGSFIFARVVEMPEKYTLKKDANIVHQEIKEEVQRTQEQLDKGIQRVVDKIDEIQIYLRDKNNDAE